MSARELKRRLAWSLLFALILAPSMLLAIELSPGQAMGLALAVALLLAMVAMRRRSSAYLLQLRALSGLVASWKDSDFSTTVRLPDEPDLVQLTQALNQVADVLRAERARLVQREMLLDTVIQNTPTAVLLADPRGRLVFANVAARDLLSAGRRLEGVQLSGLLAGLPPALQGAIDGGQDALCTLVAEQGEQTWHVSQRSFMLNGRPHQLLLLRHMTHELTRQEVATWKKVIRVISHELNNSLAPISSLAHSGRELAERGEPEKLRRVFDTIEDRARHLDRFIRDYATFAKLPLPQATAQRWSVLLAQLAHQVQVRVGEVPDDDQILLDPAQIAQVLINLVRNAHESGAPADSVEIGVQRVGQTWRVEVRDRGCGMTAVVLQNALLPFYSTKRSGTGLGLALSREIVEAHGGRIALANRDGGGLTAAIWLPVRVQSA